MRIRKSHLLQCAAGILISSFALLLPQKASAIGTLSCTWSCDAYAHCTFTRTSSNHATYQWNFGDGNFSGLTTVVTTHHTYAIPYTDTPQNFDVSFMGYTTSSGASIDNIVGATVTTYRNSIGGDPTTYSGSCS